MFSKLSTALKIKRAVDHIQKHPDEIMNPQLKPGVTSSEFWVLIGTHVLLAAMAALQKLDGELAVLLGGALTAIYNYVRSGFKLSLGLKIRDGVSTSEFWALLVTAGFDLALAALDKVDGQWATLTATAISAVYMLCRKSLKGMEIRKAAPAP